MTLEEVLIGGVVGGVWGIGGTAIGYWLHSRGTRKARELQETRVRSLLASEIGSNLSQVIFARELERQLEAKGVEHGPAELILSKDVYNAFVGDIALLPPNVTEKVLQSYESFSDLNTGSRAWKEETSAERKKAVISLWDDLAGRADAAATEALDVLGADSQLSRAEFHRKLVRKLALVAEAGPPHVDGPTSGSGSL